MFLYLHNGTCQSLSEGLGNFKDRYINVKGPDELSTRDIKEESNNFALLSKCK